MACALAQTLTSTDTSCNEVSIGKTFYQLTAQALVQRAHHISVFLRFQFGRSKKVVMLVLPFLLEGEVDNKVSDVNRAKM